MRWIIGGLVGLVLILGLIFIVLHRPHIPNDRIIAAIDPWVLACAVGVSNNTANTPLIDFPMWWRLSKNNWLPLVQKKTGATEDEVQEAVVEFIGKYPEMSIKDVLHIVERDRGLPESTVLGPGDSVKIKLPVYLPPGEHI